MDLQVSGSLFQMCGPNLLIAVPPCLVNKLADVAPSGEKDFPSTIDFFSGALTKRLVSSIHQEHQLMLMLLLLCCMCPFAKFT